ncbi:methyl-accepting chemotaxis protein [Parashewanella spongiae]|uniref:Methyl-accepting chemotaxis protein n=1 Tax=Parashewanella spongiae TaxID=342950 RepID=A0A3A6UJA9_9GAMM|nr:methyl-accepting chemotaxis protein [Parashewanella spongiae]MCL1076836.1 methyl-accepting chemotaxis protein [Parashewanella spongiae]RJY19204.1 methyl-accepting chemotaxis protein [Parashewanella spongiae]
MKEVKFRWIDKYLIQTTIRAKFIILACISIFTLLFLSFLLNQKYTDISKTTRLSSSIANVSQHNILIDKALEFIPGSKQQTFIANLSPELQVRPLSELPLKQQQVALDGGGVIASQVISSVSPSNNVTIQTLKQNSITTNESSELSIFSYGVTSALIILVIISVYYVSTFIRGALYTTVQALKQAADGDLTSRLNFFLVKDEFSTLAISIDTLVDRQHQLVKQVVNATTQIRTVVAEFRNNAQQGQSLAVNQRQHLDSLATAMEEMTAAVKEVSRNAEQSSTETQEANNQVNNGSKDIDTTVRAIGTLANDISNASDAVNQLNDNASRIDEVVTTINAISEQTNLLALNAAIEAARAGEQGRGFAVVADEVRTLAGRTQHATVEIKTMIESLQSGASALTQVMSRTVEQAEQGKLHVVKTGEDLENIAVHSDKVLDMSVLIATSAEEQSAVANDIASNLMDIRNQSHDVETSANDAVSGCDELHATAEQLDQLLVGLKV